MLLPSSLLWYNAAKFCVLSILYNTDHLPVTRGIVLQNACRKQIFGGKPSIEARVRAIVDREKQCVWLAQRLLLLLGERGELQAMPEYEHGHVKQQE